MKIRLVGTELFQADGQVEGQTDRHSRFSQFCRRAYKWVRKIILRNLTTELTKTKLQCVSNSGNVKFTFITKEQISRSCLQLAHNL
jgi:hypothetical protein